MIGYSLATERLDGEGAADDTDVPILPLTSSTSSADDDGSRFLLPLAAAACGGGDDGASRTALRCCAALAWRENIASMPSLRFWTGSMNVGDSVPTLPTSVGRRSYHERANQPHRVKCQMFTHRGREEERTIREESLSRCMD